MLEKSLNFCKNEINELSERLYQNALSKIVLSAQFWTVHFFRYP